MNYHAVNTKVIYNSCGAEQVSYDELSRIPAIRKSPTHQPIKHAEVADAIKRSLQSYGNYEITEETYGVSHKGQRCFSLLRLRDEKSRSDYDTVYIFRNANDMGFSLRCGTGGVVGICSNMMFVAELEISGAKHTKNIFDTFSDRMSVLNKKLLDSTDSMHKKYDGYKSHILGGRTADHIIMEAVRKGALPKTKIDKVDGEWRKPSYSYFGQSNSAWQLFNAFTHVNKGLNYVDQISRTQKLHKVFDSYLEG
tara:strand:+ start:195 stop:950 length:756 start_codon:yes stop_codon:yes gene_type:complete